MSTVCQKCMSPEADKYMLAESRRAVVLCLSCYNELQDVIAEVGLKLKDSKYHALEWIACYTGSGPAEIQRLSGNIASAISMEESYLLQMISYIDSFVSSRTPNVKSSVDTTHSNDTAPA